MGNVLLLSLIIVGAAEAQPDAPAAAAKSDGKPACVQCGCGYRPKKICRLKVGEGTYTGVDFDVKCEDYCIRGHSTCCGHRWVPDPPCGYCGAHKVPIWKAACGALKTRKYLVKAPKTNKVTTYTCVVETICCRCGHCAVDEAATAEALAREIRPVSFDRPIILDAGELPPNTPVVTDAADSPEPGQTHRRLAE
jgi:hypothetical protein